MTRHWQLEGGPRVWLAATACIGAIVQMVAAPALAVVTVTGDPEFNYNGITNTAPFIFTVDPLENPPVTATGQRGVAADRRLRQTFKNPSEFDVSEIVFGFDVTGGADVGLRLAIYEVADVLSGTWTPLGDAVWERSFTDVLPGSSANLSFSFTDDDVFTLPARGTSGDTLGYGIEISVPVPDPSAGNPGVVIHTNVSEMDFYPDGRYYTESGGASSAHRDLGVSFIGGDDSIPGDTNGDNVVDVEIDLAAIAAHFRQNVTLRADGDLTRDGYVDFDDFDQWKSNFTGSIEGVDLSFLTVPEPSAGAMLIGLLFGCAARRRRLAHPCK